MKIIITSTASSSSSNNDNKQQQPVQTPPLSTAGTSRRGLLGGAKLRPSRRPALRSARTTANTWLPFTGRDDLTEAIAAFIEDAPGPRYDGCGEIVITCREKTGVPPRWAGRRPLTRTGAWAGTSALLPWLRTQATRAGAVPRRATCIRTASSSLLPQPT